MSQYKALIKRDLVRFPAIYTLPYLGILLGMLSGLLTDEGWAILYLAPLVIVRIQSLIQFQHAESNFMLPELKSIEYRYTCALLLSTSLLLAWTQSNSEYTFTNLFLELALLSTAWLWVINTGTREFFYGLIILAAGLNTFAEMTGVGSAFDLLTSWGIPVDSFLSDSTLLLIIASVFILLNLLLPGRIFLAPFEWKKGTLRTEVDSLDPNKAKVTGYSFFQNPIVSSLLNKIDRLFYFMCRKEPFTVPLFYSQITTKCPNVFAFLASIVVGLIIFALPDELNLELIRFMISFGLVIMLLLSTLTTTFVFISQKSFMARLWLLDRSGDRKDYMASLAKTLFLTQLNALLIYSVMALALVTLLPGSPGKYMEIYYISMAWLCALYLVLALTLYVTENHLYSANTRYTILFLYIIVFIAVWLLLLMNTYNAVAIFTLGTIFSIVMLKQWLNADLQLAES